MQRGTFKTKNANVQATLQVLGNRRLFTRNKIVLAQKEKELGKEKLHWVAKDKRTTAPLLTTSPRHLYDVYGNLEEWSAQGYPGEDSSLELFFNSYQQIGSAIIDNEGQAKNIKKMPVDVVWYKKEGFKYALDSEDKRIVEELNEHTKAWRQLKETHAFLTECLFNRANIKGDKTIIFGEEVLTDEQGTFLWRKGQYAQLGHLLAELLNPENREPGAVLTKFSKQKALKITHIPEWRSKIISDKWARRKLYKSRLATLSRWENVEECLLAIDGKTLLICFEQSIIPELPVRQIVSDLLLEDEERCPVAILWRTVDMEDEAHIAKPFVPGQNGENTNLGANIPKQNLLGNDPDSNFGDDDPIAPNVQEMLMLKYHPGISLDRPEVAGDSVWLKDYSIYIRNDFSMD